MNFTTISLGARFALSVCLTLFFLNNGHSQNSYCVSKSSAPWSEWIAQVQLNTLNNATEKTRADRYVVGYSDWTDKTAHVSRNQTYTLTILNGLSWSGYRPSLFYRAWIDFNGNGVFEDIESVLEQGNIGVGVYQSITIPATALIGTVKMRVSMKKDALPSACETFAAGEVEDYSIVIQDGTTGGCTPSVPTKLYAKDITATTAKLVWSKVNNAVEYEYQVLYDDTSQPNGGALISSGIVADTFANLTLVLSRLRALVRSRCVAGGTWSAWSLATHFNQQNELCTQAARTTFIEDFENTPVATTTTTFGLPLCWTKLTYHAPSVIEAWTDVRSTNRGTVGDNTKRVILYRSTPLTDSALIMLVSPEISNLSAGTNRLRFKAANTFGVDASGNAVIQIGTLSNPFDASSFTPFGSQTVINGQVFAEYIVDFAAYHGSDRYIVFKYISSGGDGYRSLEIDDVAWETRPSNPCLNDVIPPVLTNCPANISVTTTGTTAVATWTAPTAADNCTTPPSVSSTHLSGQGFPIGTTAVVYTARDAANNSATCAFSIVVSANTATTNCVSKSNAPWSEWISNVQFNTLNNTSSKTRDDRFVVGYSDWKDLSTTVSRSQTHPLSITPGLSWSGYQTPLYFRTWIDFNRNGIYEDAELVLEKNSNSAVVNQSVTIPATASMGTTTMRVSMKKGAYATACESFDLGEVEDYTVVIQDGNPTSCANNALNFDGVDDYLQTVQNMIPANSNFTMEASFTSTATTVGCNGSFKRLLALELSNSANRLEIGECSGQLTLFYFISGGNSRLVNISTASNLRDGNWHHVAAVKNGDALSIYYDGTLVLTELGLLNINNVARALYVGRWGLQGENWQGNVDEVRVWNYAVSATDIVNRRLCQLTGSETGLVLYFPFNQGVSGGSNPTINTVIDKSLSNVTTLMTNFGLSGATSNWVCSTQTLSQGCTTTDPCANDVTPPVVVNCPQNIVLTNTTNQCQMVSFTPPSATDNCTPPAYSAILKNGSQFLNFTPTTNADLIIGRWDIGSSYEKTIDAAGNVLSSILLPASNGVTSVFQNGVYTTLTSSGKWELSADGTKFIGDKGAVDERYYKIIALSTTEWKEIGPYRLDGTPYFGNKLYEYWASKKPNMFVNICPNIPIDSVLFTFNDTKGNISNCRFNITVTQPVNTCRYNDSLVLVDVYNSMGGANWVNKWDLTKPMNTWMGIGTDTNGCVIAFSSGQLTGNLAPSIGNLSQLRYMRLGGSRAITGTIPNSFANLSNLIELQIEDNQLTGSIPSFVGNLRNLNQILLYKNMLTGPIPTTFGNLTKMQWLILNNNQLSGVIPTSLSNMTLLNALELSNNSFTGSIPNVFGDIPSLTYLGLKNNNFSGTLPKNLAQLTNINKLDLSNNLLSGCIPNELKPLCGKDVILSGNINLPNSGDWAAFCSTNAGACPVTNDLEVSVVANAATFKKWTNTGFKVNLKNLGSQAFTNIELTFPYPTGTVNGGTPTPSVGTFQQYCAGGVICYKWTIPSLAAGTTATLDVPLFVLDVATILGTAQLLTSTPTDVNAANNTATATMTLQTIVPSLTSKPTQLIPVVIQTLSPNPTDGELNLKLESLDTREVTFEFYNALGKAVKSEKRVIEKGLNRVDFSLFDLEQGVYFIVPSTGQGRKVPTKFVKL